MTYARCFRYRELQSTKVKLIEDEWQHISVSYDGSNIMMFQNGYLRDMRVFEETLFSSILTPFAVGDRMSLTQIKDPEIFILDEASNETVGIGTPMTLDEQRIGGFQGQIYNVHVFSTALSNEQVLEDYRCPDRGTHGMPMLLDVSFNTFNGPDLYHKENVARGIILASNQTSSYVDASFVGCYTNQTDAWYSEASGQGLSEAVAGAPAYISVQARDNCGKIVARGGDNVTVIISSINEDVSVTYSTLKEEIMDHYDGSYLLNYTITSAGNYSIDVALNGVIMESTYLSVYPQSETDPSRTCLFLNSPTSGILQVGSRKGVFLPDNFFILA